MLKSMTKTLNISHGNKELEISDFDIDNEIEINVSNKETNRSQFIYLTKQDLDSLDAHIQYLKAQYNKKTL